MHCRKPALLGRRGRQASEQSGMLLRVRHGGPSGGPLQGWPQVMLLRQAKRRRALCPGAPQQTQPLLLPAQLGGLHMLPLPSSHCCTAHVSTSDLEYVFTIAPHLQLCVCMSYLCALLSALLRQRLICLSLKLSQTRSGMCAGGEICKG